MCFFWLPVIERSKQIRTKQRANFFINLRQCSCFNGWSWHDTSLKLIVLTFLASDLAFFKGYYFLFLKIRLITHREPGTPNLEYGNVELLFLPIVIAWQDYVKDVPMWGQCFLLWRLVLELEMVRHAHRKRTNGFSQVMSEKSPTYLLVRWILHLLKRSMNWWWRNRLLLKLLDQTLGS